MPLRFLEKREERKKNDSDDAPVHLIISISISIRVSRVCDDTTATGQTLLFLSLALSPKEREREREREYIFTLAVRGEFFCRFREINSSKRESPIVFKNHHLSSFQILPSSSSGHQKIV